MNNWRLILYVCFVQVVAGLLFFLGFFQYTPPSRAVSSRNDLPMAVNGIRLEAEKLYRRHYAKTVLIIIDAFRLDFILGGNRMPFLQRHMNLSSSCMLPTKVEVPTVTLPRIKAILSGVAPGFLDILHNFGSDTMAGDNIINQATQNGYKIVFYGDDTWLKLFPDSFSRYEGISSFYVNDFYEVDLNVTRNAKRELYRQDWDLMILHYLGLDHIGHIEGPYGPSIPSKLLEMDEIIEYVFRTSQNVEKSGKEKLIVVTGDHGMKNSGGHGGSSAEEVMVPFILLNHHCDFNLMDRSFQQVDITPFLSVLLGLPIPAGSTGKVSQRWLKGLNDDASLYTIFYSTQLMKNRLSLEDDDVEDHYNQGIEYYSSWMKYQRPNDKMKAIEHFLYAQEIIAKKSAKRGEVNIYSLATAISLSAMALVLLVADHHSSVKISPLELLWDFFFNNKVNSCLTLLVAFSSSTWLLSFSRISLEYLGVGVVALTFLNTIRLLLTSSFSPKILLEMEYLNLALLSIVALLPVSYLSTSFIEEEHYYWYFTFATLLVFLVYKDLGRWRSILLILCLQRFLKKLNQTGDKWADLPDVGDWLRLPENCFFLSGFYSIGFGFGLMMTWRQDFFQKSSRRKFCNLGLLFFTGQAISIASYRIASGQVWASLSSSTSNGVFQVKLFWFFTVLKLLHSLFHIFRLERRHVPSAIISTIAQLHYSIVSLLVKPHNAVLGPSLLLFSELLSSLISDPWQLIVLHYWMGTAFFFYLGNSNSIASLDVAVGFVGLEEYNVFLAFTYGALHTYAYPILSYLLLCGELLKRNNAKEDKADNENDLLAPKTYLFLNGLPLLVYMVVIFIQREHLFIWSVFSPKLLYLMVHSVMVIALVVPSCFLL